MSVNVVSLHYALLLEERFLYSKREFRLGESLRGKVRTFRDYTALIFWEYP